MKFYRDFEKCERIKIGVENSHNAFFCCFYRQLDSRLTRVPPNRATISVTPSKERGDIDETAVRQTIIKNVNAGKAKAYDKVEIKVHNDLQVKVQ